MASPLLETIARTRVARFSELKPFSLAFVDSLLPEGRKKNLKVIGRGVVENADMQPPITEDHGFTISYIVVPPGGGAGLHAHKTAEVFIPISGPVHVLIGDDKEELVLQPLDVISVPTGVMRGFRNHGEHELTMLALVGGHTGGGSVTWHDEVLSRAATESGLAVDEKGNLKRLPNFKMPEDVEGSVL
ncbi:cupin domain-containing protein [Pigmentiphaga kullae]|uniref:Mannose-6-phosphate isomerase-like protein (Cupin superfamily) n=1 Tax=Pigmentiphaga kullae TaxID=151784 RepID=A0A4Q7NJ78_9BURK|nr:cupin domain-containing protein [Pigmentiphaga kullae]RZS84882.1 mannose-6-phosphate isomerase-like protein (cupin superfamily) [Pigmentiphaga kullae]